MDVGVGALIITGDGVDHGLWFMPPPLADVEAVKSDARAPSSRAAISYGESRAAQAIDKLVTSLCWAWPT